MHPSFALLLPRLNVPPALVIFDKDGTLIDFNAMWGAWITGLAQTLEAAAGVSVAQTLYAAMNFDPTGGRIAAGGHLALDPMAKLRVLTAGVLRQAGLSPEAAQGAMAAAWRTPNPAALAHPLADLPALFGALRAGGAKVAIATSDDRAPTKAMLHQFGAAALVDALVCADDGLPIKPAPDMILTLCRRFNISPAQTAMVGDNLPDMQMGRAAGAGLVVGVLSGVGSAADLAPHADLLLGSVAELLV
ncbi:MAG: HAD family hydrolase [Anaerolineae bacterium]